MLGKSGPTGECEGQPRAAPRSGPRDALDSSRGHSATGQGPKSRATRARNLQGRDLQRHDRLGGAKGSDRSECSAPARQKRGRSRYSGRGWLAGPDRRPRSGGPASMSSPTAAAGREGPARPRTQAATRAGRRAAGRPAGTASGRRLANGNRGQRGQRRQWVGRSQRPRIRPPARPTWRGGGRT